MTKHLEIVQLANVEIGFSFKCAAECIMNQTGMLQDQTFLPEVATDVSRKALGPKSVWLPVVESGIKTCNDYGMVD